MDENAGTLGGEMRALASKGGIISAFVIFLVGLSLGAVSARAVYKDQAEHWRHLYQGVNQRRALSDKDLKTHALSLADSLDGLRARRVQASALTQATRTIANAIGFDQECGARQSDARGVRDEILQRIPSVYRDSAASSAYEAADCVKSLSVITGDVRSMARRLPD